VQQIKRAGRPIIPEAQRAEVVAALGFVDWVTLFDESDPLTLIRLLRPNVLVKGADWPEDEIIGAAEVKESGGKVVRIPLEEGMSTSEVINRISAAVRKKGK
jgi:D-beta-D-heptose 7-phosphate kinase/D-beta-D-heptose 1-phosphate adenosyltransferase